MPRAVHDDVLDAALEHIRSNCDLVTFCAGQPTTYAQATDPPSSGGKRLANHAVTSGDFSIGDGSTGGRSLTMAEQLDSVDEAGTGDHIAFVDTGAAKILYVTTTSEQPVSAGQSFEFPVVEVNISDPAAL